MQEVAKFAQSLREYPPRQASFDTDLDKMFGEVLTPPAPRKQ